MRTITTILTVAAITALAVAGTASAASAVDPSFGIVRSPATSYMLPTYGSTPVHVGLTYDQRVHVRCVTDGQTVDGNPLWYRIGVTGNMGFVPVGKVYTAERIPSCSMG